MTSALASRRRVVPSASTVVLAAVTATLSAFTVWWWGANRRGLPWFIDEAGYLTFAIDHAHAIRDEGVSAALFDHSDGPYGPLIPWASGTALAIVDRPYGVAMATMVVSGAGLVLASWFLARRLTGPWWAILVASLVGTCPVVIALTGVYYLAVPAAALFTFALACLLRSEHGRHPGWCIAAGISLALATLTRTMVLGLVPAVVVVAVVGAVRGREGRTRRLVTLAASGAAGLLVMAPWWIPNLGEVLDYLGQPSHAVSSPVAGPGRTWQVTGMRDLRLLISDLLLPTAVALLIVAVVSMVVWWQQGRPRGVRSVGAVSLAGVVLLSAAVLAISGEATGQWVPLLPAIMVLAVTGLAELSWPRARRLGVGALCALMGFNLAVASRAVGNLSEPRAVTIGPLGRLSVTDGRWLLEQQFRTSKLEAGGRLPRSYEAMEEVLERIVRRAAAAGEPAVLVVPSSADPVMNTNVLKLTDRLLHDRPRLIVGGFPLPQDLDLDELQIALADPQLGQPTLILSDNRQRIEDTLSAVGFSAIDSMHLPDGRTATLWWRPRSALVSARGRETG